tara:strand:- start:746 stop:1387 length:642 start_codon:yes stop_codon:yes gene_type:complete
MSRGGRLGGQGPGQYRNSPLNGFGGPMPSMPMGSPQMNPNKGGSRMSLADMQAPGGFGGPSPLAQAKFPQQNDYAVGRPNMDILTGNYASPGLEQAPRTQYVARGFEQAPQQQSYADIGAGFNEMVAPGMANPQPEALPMPAQPNNFLSMMGPADPRPAELMPAELMPVQQVQPQLMSMQPQRAMMEMQSQRFDPLMSGGLASLPFSRPRFMR